MRLFTSLTMGAMIDLASPTVAPIPDSRDPARVSYGLHDTLMSGFAMMFLQSPTLLELQRKMQQRRHRWNLETLFGGHEVPSDTQMRDMLDGVPVELIRSLWPVLCEKIRRAGWAKDFTTIVSRGADHGAY